MTGGVTGAVGAIKALMCGAHAVQMVSLLLEQGPEMLGRVRDEAAAWMGEHGYTSLDDLRGRMSLEGCRTSRPTSAPTT